MPLGLNFGVVDHCDQPVPIPPDIEYDIAIDIVGVLEGAAHLRKTVPSDSFDDLCPGRDLICRVRILLRNLTQMSGRYDIHHAIILHKL